MKPNNGTLPSSFLRVIVIASKVPLVSFAISGFGFSFFISFGVAIGLGITGPLR